ncbi:unnamed protein product [Blepharisma stoltei]|uniref:Uncharacterized protein n=1 Tax=Blepharisma stoltei TaxID=1481888 RepID=A0AAU9JY20_9CILI|nr:unnamed protein product [Blepharisma stoltei]
MGGIAVCCSGDVCCTCICGICMRDNIIKNYHEALLSEDSAEKTDNPLARFKQLTLDKWIQPFEKMKDQPK